MTTLIVTTKSNGIEWVMERNVSDSGWDQTVKSVAVGEWTWISEIRRFDTGEIVTHLIAEEVARIWDRDGEPLSDWQKDFLRDNGIGKRRLPAENIREIGRNATVAEPLRTILNSFAGGFGR